MEPNAMEQLVGHRVIEEVCFKDGRVEKCVEVRELAVKDFPDYAKVTNNEPRAIELFCGKEEGWANELTLKSHEELLAAGEDMNLHFFGCWRRRKEERFKKTDPEGFAALRDKTSEMINALQKEIEERQKAAKAEESSTGSPKSPSSAD